MTTYSDEEYLWDILRTPEDISHREFRAQHDKIWLTMDRRFIRIKDMETSHITNSIGMLQRAGQTDTKAYQGLTSELNHRAQKLALQKKKGK